MKKRLKGLACWWLVLVMLVSTMVTPVMALPSNGIYLYTGTSPLKVDDDFYPYTRSEVDEGTQLSSLVTTPDGATLSGWNLWNFKIISSGFVISEKLLTKDADWILSADDVKKYAKGDYFAFEPVWAYTVKLYTGDTKLADEASVVPSEITEIQVTLDVPLKDQVALSAYIPEDLIGWKRWTFSDGSVNNAGFTAADKTLTKYNIKDTMLLEAVDFAMVVVSKNPNPLNTSNNYSPKNEKKVYLDFGEKLSEADAVINELAKPAGYILDGWKLWGGVECGGVYTDRYDELKTVAVDYALTKEDALSLGSSSYQYLLILEPLWMQKYKIDPQPTSESPTVGVKEYDKDQDIWTDITDDSGMSYQWYEITSETYYLTDEHTDLVEAAEAEYSDGAWHLYDYWTDSYPVILCLDQGITLRVEPVGTTGVLSISIDGQQLEDKGEYWETTLSSAVDTNLIVDYQNEPVSGDGVKIQITESGLSAASSGQTTKTLSSAVDGNQYVCCVTFENGDVLTSDAVTYTAPPTYTVTFDANGGSGTMVNQTITLGEATALSENTFTRDGYTFEGWATTADGAKVYNDQQSVTDLADAGESITLFAVWTEKTTITIYDVQQQYDYTGEPIAFDLNSLLSGFTVKYRVKDTTTWSDSIPTEVNTYDVKITRAEDAYYKAYEMTFFGKLVINKAVVSEPDIASKVYNGENQTAEVPSSKLYTVESNDGRTNVGSANVVLKLVDSANYKWSSTTEDSVTLPFVVTKADNAWITEPSIEGWTYGDEAKTPSYAAKFGEVVVEYKKASEEDSSYTTNIPENAGNYKVKFTVEENTNFESLSKILDLTIAKAIPSLEAPTAQNDITYGAALSTVGLTEGWTWLDGTTIPTVQNSGFAAYFTPADTANYDWTGIGGWNEVESRVEKTVSVVVTKADSSIAAAPTAILNLEYDGSAKAL
ncbi:MAG: InlB B-repeat-containing protein, partial [Oscillospiraceae bacterium]|nr:InlB B-repeat-containing protein [Oscillospiraceae bacterium]